MVSKDLPALKSSCIGLIFYFHKGSLNVHKPFDKFVSIVTHSQGQISNIFQCSEHGDICFDYRVLELGSPEWKDYIFSAVVVLCICNSHSVLLGHDDFRGAGRQLFNFNPGAVSGIQDGFESKIVRITHKEGHFFVHLDIKTR